jgi:hypothetical protein
MVGWYVEKCAHCGISLDHDMPDILCDGCREQEDFNEQVYDEYEEDND